MCGKGPNSRAFLSGSRGPLGAYPEAELDLATARALEGHLVGCEECTAFLNTYRGTVGATRQLRGAKSRRD
ncbi:MAG: zf-HC2 domain-containing protein [Candidatus Methylomirabilia bacterium]